MQTRKIATLAALIVAVAATGYAVGQNNQADDAQFEKRIDEADDNLDSGLNSEVKSGAQKTTSTLAEAVNSSAYTRVVTSKALSAFYTGSDPKAAVKIEVLQAMQNARIIEQNAEIIALLKAQSKDK